MTPGNGHARPSEAAADAAAQQAANLTEWHPYCTEACSGRHEHTETLWLYVENPPRRGRDSPKMRSAIAAGVAETLAAQFGCDYIAHAITDEPLVRREGDKTLTTSLLTVERTHVLDAGLAAIEATFDPVAALPAAATDAAMVGIRVTFGCPFTINALRRFYLTLYPEDAARIGMRVSGESE